MKALKKICQVLIAVFGLASLVMFCFTFAKFNMTTGEVQASGLQIAFGAQIGDLEKIARSTDILFCFWMSVLTLVLGVATFFAKTTKLKYFVAGVSLVPAIYMLVVLLSNPWKFVDSRPFTAVTESITYGPFVAYAVIALFVTAAAAVAYMFVSDYVEVLASKGEKKVLIKRVVQFFKDYKSETKKIVWPGLREVVKNTVIVLIMCAIIGALIWLVDWGLGSLLKLVW